MEKYLKHSIGFLRKEACWVMSNILVSGRFCIKKTYEFKQATLLKELIKIALTDNFACR